MTDDSRRDAPPSPNPAPDEPAATVLPQGASDATLWIFLGGVMLMLMICVVFILVAS